MAGTFPFANENNLIGHHSLPREVLSTHFRFPTKSSPAVVGPQQLALGAVCHGAPPPKPGTGLEFRLVMESDLWLWFL